MANKAIEAMAVCPFYQREGKVTVTCEGILGKGMVSVFDSPSNKVLHEAEFCCGRWEVCPLAAILLKKHAE